MEKKRYRVTVTIGGESYTIRGDSEPDRVQKIAGLFDERLRQVDRAIVGIGQRAAAGRLSTVAGDGETGKVKLRNSDD